MKSRLALSLLAALAFSACQSAPKQYARPPLAEQVLRPRPGFKGLTNAVCKRQEDGACAWEILEYDLSDKATRLRLRSAKFICKVAGEAYRVAQDEPALIHEEYKKKCTLGIFGCRRELAKVKLLPVSDYQALLDGDTTCFSVDRVKSWERTP